ncbi:MAG: potassium transporter Kup [Rhizobiales bacterium]|nr:potassium transporter Kup [Hyphomicrobiales bacterium]
MSVDRSPQTPTDPHDPGAAHGGHGRFLALLVGSIGVVYGDIGTSPLYALREALTAAGASHHGVERADVIGILSLILWALTIIVSVKYVVILLRADNDGEGGTLSLMALAQRALGRPSRVVFLLAITGAALFFGDAMITPAISVLSAVEGLKLITPALEPYVIPITVVIILALFLAQSHGTAAVARLFGPITIVWFIAMALGGLAHIADDPGVFAAINPLHAARFLIDNGHLGLVALGAVFLAVTGAEALYADLGHFGRSPIRWAWAAIVFPSLALNYMGQAALVLAKPTALENPFFLLYPEWLLAPMVALATLATIIASQAVITGAYSLTRQAIQLRLLPRMEVRHTSAEHSGQIYMPQVNTLVLIGVLFLVALFQSSSKLATAYGIAVTGTMIVTACLAFIVVWRAWGWPRWAAALLIAPFLAIDLIFFGANALKLLEGGFVPLMIAALVMIVMWTWTRGAQLVFDKTRREEAPIADLARQLAARPPQRVKGTAVFLTADPEIAPPALMHSLKHYKVLHEKNVLLTVKVENTPRVNEARRARLEALDDNFSRVFLTFGYMEEPNVPKALALCRKQGWKFDIMSTSFFLSRRVIRAARDGRAMPLWQDKLFISLAQNASDTSAYFHIPTNRVVEIGAQVSI